MKKHVRIFYVAIAMLVLLSNNNSLAYSDSKTSCEMQNKSEVIFSIQGKDVSKDLLEELDAYSVNVSADTSLKLVRMSTMTKATAAKTDTDSGPVVLIVSNRIGNNVSTDLYFAIGSDGNFVSVVPDDENPAAPKSGSSAHLLMPPYDSNLIQANALYTEVYESSTFFMYPDYQPIGMFFIYHANGINSITFADVEYETIGFEYTYPGFVDVSGGYTHQHNIRRTVYNPASNTMYQKVNEYRTDRVLRVSSGAPLVGLFFTFEFTIDGHTIDGSVSIL